MANFRPFTTRSSSVYARYVWAETINFNRSFLFCYFGQVRSYTFLWGVVANNFLTTIFKFTGYKNIEMQKNKKIIYFFSIIADQTLPAGHNFGLNTYVTFVLEKS